MLLGKVAKLKENIQIMKDKSKKERKEIKRNFLLNFLNDFLAGFSYLLGD